MHKEIIINSTPNEARVALLEDHEVVEFMMERADDRRAVGNVYKGVVTAVRPGLQAAFVDIGMEKGGFLHVSDLIHDDPGDDDDGGRRRGRGRRREGMRPIETMLKEGDEILVQVTKEVIGTKGPRLTADISLPGRFMVLMPKGDHVGVSRKIDDRKERGRLKGILSDLKPDDEAGAFIIRTAAIGQDAKMIERDMQYLRDLWKEINQRAHTSQAPAVVHEDVGLIVSLIRDIFKNDVDSVVVDGKDDYNRLMQYVKTFSPDLRDRISLYSGEMPIFDKYGIEAELKKSLDKKVWMKRGGFLVIEQTEALVAIDVNTGRFIGKKNQAETIFKTNMLAAKEIARQLRLRDVGGIIVLDFIDMDAEEDKRRVLAELRQHLKRDRSRTKTFAVSDLGLIEMSRQRVQESLKDRLSDNCPYCHGSGQVLSVDTLSNKVERLLAKLAVTRNEKAVQVRANPTLALQIMTERANAIQSIERSTGMKIDVVDDARLHREEFQIVSLARRKDLVAEIEKSGDKGSGAEERRGRGDSRGDGRGDSREESRGESRRGGRDRDDRRDESDDSRRRRPRREEETGDAPAERGSRRSRRRRRDEDAPAERSARPRGDERSEESGRGDEDRSRRRRRGQRSDDDRSRRPQDDAVEARGDQENTSAAEGTHPAAEGEEDRPRRRRRRGRRGGRGRRRGRAGENGEAAEGTNDVSSETRSESTRQDAPRDEQTRRRPSRADDRSDDRSDDRAEERVQERDEERVVERGPETVEATSDTRDDRDDVGSDEGSDSDRPRRRRRRSRRTSSAPRPEDTNRAETTAPREETPAPPEDEDDASVDVTAAEATVEDTAPDVDFAEDDDRPTRRGRRRGGRGRRGGGDRPTDEAGSRDREPTAPREDRQERQVGQERQERVEPEERRVRAEKAATPGNGVGGRIDTSESYVRPVPEGSTEPIARDEEPEDEPAEAEAPASARAAQDGGAGDDDESRTRHRKRRRRTRSAGTPTRLIGTGKQRDDQKD